MLSSRGRSFNHAVPVSDIRELPTYTFAEVSQYLAVPVSTIRYWSVGRSHYVPLISVPERLLVRPLLLSFLNLVELHILAALRREYKIAMPKVRTALRYLSGTDASSEGQRHPLISCVLQTDGLNLFEERYGNLINISQSGQLAMREILKNALSRVEYDSYYIPVKLYPFTRNEMCDAPKIVVIDPKISAGRPVIFGTGITTEIISERNKAGESMSQLATDYEREQSEIEEAIRCQINLAA